MDNASCRSRLSDYGFTSESEDEQDWGGCYGDDMETPNKENALPEDFGFWAEVGAIGVLPLAMVHTWSCLPGKLTRREENQDCPVQRRGAPCMKLHVIVPL